MPIKEAKTVAFERDAEIHLLVAVSKVLANWDEDAALAGGVEQVTLLETLLLHEMIELVLDETAPDLDPLTSHIIATAFERYLKGTMLTVAVEDFFLDWPPLSSAEQEELTEKQMQQELEEASALLGEEEIPERFEDDIEDLPLDDATPRRKKKVAKELRKKKKKRE